jgi:hypothetical protein
MVISMVSLIIKSFYSLLPEFPFWQPTCSTGAISVTFFPLARYQLLVKNQNYWALKKEIRG